MTESKRSNTGKWHLFRIPENLSDALRNTAVILLPLLIGYRQAPELTAGMATGVLIISLTDLPGNRQRKTQTAWQALLIMALVALSFSFCLGHPFATGIILSLFSCCLPLLSMFGPRAGNVGMSGIALMIFMLGVHPQHPLLFSAYMLLGGTWFYAVVLLQIYLFPFRSLRQELQDLLNVTADLLAARANCYDLLVPLETAHRETIKLHLLVTEKQQAVRELLLSDKAAMRTANAAAQHLLATSVFAIQLYEQITATAFDHSHFRDTLNKSEALQLIYLLIRRQAISLSQLAKQLPYGAVSFVDQESRILEERLLNLAGQSKPEAAELITPILHNAAAIRAMLTAMANGDNASSNLPQQDLQRFLPDAGSIFPRLTDALHWRSPFLRFSLRLMLMLSVTYTIITIWTKDPYNYWFLLTILVVSRPRIAITWKRNLQRLSGTFIGLAIAYLLLQVFPSSTVRLTLAAVALPAFYAWNRSNYFRSVLAITISAVIFASVYTGLSHGILSARLLYTIAGCILAMGGLFIFPVWVRAELDQLACGAIAGNRILLSAVLAGDSTTDIRLARKEAHQRLARFAEGLQHARYEPGVPDLSRFDQVLLINYRLNSVILSVFLSHVHPMNKIALNNALHYLHMAEQGHNIEEPHHHKELTLPETLALELLKLSVDNQNA